MNSHLSTYSSYSRYFDKNDNSDIYSTIFMQILSYIYQYKCLKRSQNFLF